MRDFYRAETYPTSRKTHQCIACLHEITTGETYVQQEGFLEGRPFRNRYHRECWEDMNENRIFEFMPGDFDPPQRCVEPDAARAAQEVGE